MSTERIWRILALLALIPCGGLVFAMANYHDDKPTSAATDLGLAIFRYGLIALVIAGGAAFVAAALRR